MHDPLVLIWDVPLIKLDVWHREPDGRDSGEVCRWPKDNIRAELAFAVKHWRHLHFRFWPYLKVKRWLRDRCAECGRRFLWKDSRSGYMGSDEVYHSPCMSLRAVRGQLDDLTQHALGGGDWTVNWRAERRLEHIRQKGDLTNG